MAHLETFKRSEYRRVLEHIYRSPNDGINRSNENIDPSRTGLNYLLGDVPAGESAEDVVASRVQAAVESTNEAREIAGRKPLYKSAGVMGSWTITLPKDWPEDEDPKLFFEEAYKYLRKRYGDMVQTASVHMDETTPHMHVPLIPLDKKQQVNRAAVFTKRDLATFHDDLQTYFDARLGYHVSVTLDDGDMVEKAKSRLSRKELDALNNWIVASVASESASKALELEAREETLHSRENAVKQRETALTAEKKRLQVQAEEQAVEFLELNDLRQRLAEEWEAFQENVKQKIDELVIEVLGIREKEERAATLERRKAQVANDVFHMVDSEGQFSDLQQLSR